MTNEKIVAALIDAAYDSGYYSGQGRDDGIHHRAAIARRETLRRKVLIRLCDPRPVSAVCPKCGEGFTVFADDPANSLTNLVGHVHANAETERLKAEIASLRLDLDYETSASDKLHERLTEERREYGRGGWR